MAIFQDDFADMVISTLPSLGEGKFTDNISTYQSTIALKKVLKAEVKKERGSSLRFQRINDHNNSFEFVGLANTVNPRIVSVLSQGEVPWKHFEFNYAWEYSLIEMNAGRSPLKIADFMQTQRIAGMASAIIGLEKMLWRAPTVAQEKEWYGIPYYIVKSSTAFTAGDSGNYGLNGLTPQDHTTVANINPTTDTTWRNYAEGYTAVTQDDLVKKMRRAMYYTGFEKLVDEIPEYAGKPDRSIYCNWQTLEPLEVLLKHQNDNLGMDLDPTGGKAMLRRMSLQAVRELDNDSTNPVYGADWATFDIKGLNNRWMHEDRIARKPDQPSVGFSNVHCTGNLVCYDRRKNWVISNGTTELSW